MKASAGFQDVDACANCGAAAWVEYGVSFEPGAIHRRQVRCTACALVFANPRLTPERMGELYGGYYDRVPIEAAREVTKRARARELLAELSIVARSGRLLEVGAGTGAFLAEARAAGFEVAGVELSQGGVDAAAEQYGLDLVRGTIEDASFEEGSLDAVVAWHVIEHVHDLDGFVQTLRRLLRPGGALLVGTESYDTPANAVFRLLRRLRRAPQHSATSSEHTFVFTAPVLADVFERRGFRSLGVQAYDELGLAERVASTGAHSPLTRALAGGIAVPAVLAARITGRGPYLRGIFVRT